MIIGKNDSSHLKIRQMSFVYFQETVYFVISYYMKSRLTRIRTTYNQEGNYDREEQFQVQKIMYDREIQWNNRYDAITERQFTLQPLELGFFSSSSLKDDPKFKQIKKILQDYNKSIVENGGEPVNGQHLKKVVMESMLKFMNLMLLAPDTATKRNILDISYQWFMKHLDPKAERKSMKQLYQQIKQIVLRKQLLPIDVVNKQLIINKVNQQLYPYKIKARTMYRQIDDPKVQLENYNTHKLEFISDEYKDEKEKAKNKKWIDTVKFPKIQPLHYSTQDFPDQQKQDQIQITDQNLTNNQQKNDQPSQPLVEGQEPPKLDQDGKPIQQPPPPMEQQQQDLDFGEPAEPDGEPQQFEEPQQKKRGKLDPLLKVFVLQRIKAKQKQQVSIEKTWQKQINKKQIIYEQDFLEGNYIREWARQKARIKTQINKKHQSMRGAPNLTRGKNSDTQSTTFIENEVDKIKIKNMVEDYKKNITDIQPPPQKLNSEPGLSLFDRRRAKTEYSHKPFSSILTEYSRKAEQNAMLQQISSIKQKFSKYKLYCPMDKFIKGLAPPDKQYIEKQDEKVVWPNSQMFSNPFIKVAKKKKKKKKK